MSNIAMWWKNSLHFTLFGGRLLTAFLSKDKQEFDHFYNVLSKVYMIYLNLFGPKTALNKHLIQKL